MEVSDGFLLSTCLITVRLCLDGRLKAVLCVIRLLLFTNLLSQKPLKFIVRQRDSTQPRIERERTQKKCCSPSEQKNEFIGETVDGMLIPLLVGCAKSHSSRDARRVRRVSLTHDSRLQRLLKSHRQGSSVLPLPDFSARVIIGSNE